MDPITPTVTTTLPISDFVGLFTPISLPTPEGALTGTLPTFGFTSVFTGSAPYGATIYQWMMDQGIVSVYFTVAIAFAALMIVIAFVWRRIRMGQAFGRQQAGAAYRAFMSMQDRYK
jgi:uncharacterized membrane protein YagU involved in acid resistance